MADQNMQEATITKAGEIHFPTWIKVVSSIMGLCFPVGIAVVGWSASALLQMKLDIAEMKPKLEMAAADRYTRSDAAANNELINRRIDQNSDDIEELQRLHGRN